MRARPRVSVLLVALVLLLSSAATERDARAEELGHLVGYVFDSTAVPLRGVRVTITPEGQPDARRISYSTDEREGGFFAFEGVPPGPYVVTFFAPKLTPGTIPRVLVKAGETAEVNFIMETTKETETLGCPIFVEPLFSTISAAARVRVERHFEGALPLPLHLSPEDAWQALAPAAHVTATDVRRARTGAGQRAIFLEGIDLTSPSSGGAWFHLPRLAFSEVDGQLSGFGGTTPMALGNALNVHSLAGSNRVEAAIAGAHEQHSAAGTSRAEARAAGFIAKDRAWYAVAAELVNRGERETNQGQAQAARTFARLSWQVTPRHKVESLTLASSTVPNRTATRGYGIFQAVRWQSLLTDALVANVHIAAGDSNAQGASDEAASHTRAVELRAELEYYTSSENKSWEHELGLDVRGRLAENRAALSAASGGRFVLSLRDRVRVNRHFTVTPGIAAVLSRAPETPSGAALAPSLAATWDAGHNGRTILRASLERRVDPGCLACVTVQPRAEWPSVVEATVGVARELENGTGLSLDLLHRWLPPLAQESGAPRVLAVTATAIRQEGKVQLLGGYTFSHVTNTADAWPTPAPHTLRLHATVDLSPTLGAGGLYHLTAGPTEGPHHEAGLRVQVRFLDRSLVVHADAAAATGAAAVAELDPLSEPLLPPPPWRVALGLRAQY